MIFLGIIKSSIALVVQWIEHRVSNPGIEVRLLSRALGKYGGYGVVVTLLFVEEPSPVQIRLATQEHFLSRERDV